MRCASPPSSAPRTLRFVVVPVVTGFGDPAAATATVGASFWIVTLAVAWRPDPESVAVTVKGPPPLAPAVKSPLESTVPPPLTVQPKVGCEIIALPNWFLTVALNAGLPFGPTVAYAAFIAT